MLSEKSRALIRKYQAEEKAYLDENKAYFEYDAGSYFENVMSHVLHAYTDAVSLDMKDKDKAPRTSRGQARDILYGTDLVLDDPARSILGNRTTLLLDITTGFGGKDFMPLVTPDQDTPLWLPGKTGKQYKDSNRRLQPYDPYNRGLVRIDGQKYLRFGIRIGCSHYGFNDPVVVVGLCSSNGLDPEDIYGASVEMASDILKYAPAVIKGANNAMTRYRYMTNQKFHDSIASKYTTEQIRERFPLLIANKKFIQEDCQKFSTCTAARLDRDYRLQRSSPDPKKKGDKGCVLQFDTDVPWLSSQGYAAIRAAKRTALPLDDGMLAKLDAALASPRRDPKVPQPIVTDMDGNVLTEDKRSDAERRLAKQLDRQFSHGREDGGISR